MGLACGKTYESPTEFPNTLKIMGICRVAHGQVGVQTHVHTQLPMSNSAMSHIFAHLEDYIG